MAILNQQMNLAAGVEAEPSAAMQGATVFNPIQLQLLQLFSYESSESELLEIRKMLADYYSRKVEREMSEMWEKGLWSDEKNKEILKMHLRTPYVRK